jgi:hypothetical protein
LESQKSLGCLRKCILSQCRIDRGSVSPVVGLPPPSAEESIVATQTTSLPRTSLRSFQEKPGALIERYWASYLAAHNRRKESASHPADYSTLTTPLSAHADSRSDRPTSNFELVSQDTHATTKTDISPILLSISCRGGRQYPRQDAVTLREEVRRMVRNSHIEDTNVIAATSSQQEANIVDTIGQGQRSVSDPHAATFETDDLLSAILEVSSPGVPRMQPNSNAERSYGMVQRVVDQNETESEDIKVIGYLGEQFVSALFPVMPWL